MIANRLKLAIIYANYKRKEVLLSLLLFCIFIFVITNNFFIFNQNESNVMVRKNINNQSNNKNNNINISINNQLSNNRYNNRNNQSNNNINNNVCHTIQVEDVRGDVNMGWSVGVATSKKLLDYYDKPSVKGAVHGGWDVDDIPALFMADPLMINVDNKWYIFTEVLNNACQKGEIGVSVSSDNLDTISYKGVVLDLPFHLSFPFIFEYEDVYYILPCITAGASRVDRLPTLYSTRKPNFPFGWKKTHSLLDMTKTDLDGPVDSVLFHYKNVWYLFTSDSRKNMKVYVYYSECLKCEYHLHPKTPTIKAMRFGGPIFQENSTDKIYLIQQTTSYIHMHEIVKLSKTELDIKYSPPFLSPRKEKWASAGMHTFDPHYISDEIGWVAVVDGWIRDTKLQLYNCVKKSKNQRDRKICWDKLLPTKLRDQRNL